MFLRQVTSKPRANGPAHLETICITYFVGALMRVLTVAYERADQMFSSSDADILVLIWQRQTAHLAAVSRVVHVSDYRRCGAVGEWAGVWNVCIRQMAAQGVRGPLGKRSASRDSSGIWSPAARKASHRPASLFGRLDPGASIKLRFVRLTSMRRSKASPTGQPLFRELHTQALPVRTAGSRAPLEKWKQHGDIPKTLGLS